MTSSPSSTTSWLTNPVVALRLLTGFGAGAAFDLAETLRFVYTRLPSIGVSRTPSFSIEAELKTHGIGSNSASCGPLGRSPLELTAMGTTSLKSSKWTVLKISSLIVVRYFSRIPAM